ncbi:MAG: GntR family transcriptional regulator, partial [Deltaproteobacteria bacterium]|nr:GntR family transcriptional regulator [Deltaproteobacteria bacterium]
MLRASLEPREGRPLYEQLAELLASDIREGRLPVGGRIPSEPELAELYRLGRPTVRQATELLVRQRLVTRRRGSGTYVTEPPGDVPLLSLAGTLEAFGRGGVELTTRLVSPPERVARARLPGSPLRGAVLAFAREGRVGGAPVLL